MGKKKTTTPTSKTSKGTPRPKMTSEENAIARRFHSLLKDAKAEIEELQEKNNKLVESKIEISTEKDKFESQLIINEYTRMVFPSVFLCITYLLSILTVCFCLTHFDGEVYLCTMKNLS